MEHYASRKFILSSAALLGAYMLGNVGDTWATK